MSGMFDGELMTGWLQKKAAVGLVKGWKNRWFVIVEEQLDAQLKYFTSERKEDLKGTVNMMEIIEIKDVINEKRTVFSGVDPELRFNVVMKDRTYELLAPDAVQKDKWVNTLSSISNVPLSSRKEVRYAFQGHLLKLSGGVTSRQKWDRRFFRLRNDENVQSLQYFKTATDISAQGTVMLSEVQEIRGWSHETVSSSGGSASQSLSGWQPPYETRFEIKTHGRVFVLAESGSRGGRLGSVMAPSSQTHSGGAAAAAAAAAAAGAAAAAEVEEEEQATAAAGPPPLAPLPPPSPPPSPPPPTEAAAASVTDESTVEKTPPPLRPALKSSSSFRAPLAPPPPVPTTPPPLSVPSSPPLSSSSPSPSTTPGAVPGAAADESVGTGAEGVGSKNAWLTILSQACEVEINEELPKQQDSQDYSPAKGIGS